MPDLQTPTPDEHDPLQLLDVKDLSRLLKRSPASIWRDHTEGRLPTALQIGRSVRWRRCEIAAWLDGFAVEGED